MKLSRKSLSAKGGKGNSFYVLLTVSMIFPLLCLGSCVQEDSLTVSESDAPYIDGTQTIIADAGGGDYAVSLSCSSEWTISMMGDADWVKAAPESGSGDAEIIFSFTPNDNIEERRASFRFTSGKKELLLVTVQKSENAILLSSTKQEISMDGGTFDIEVRANIEYDFEIDADWISHAGTETSSGNTSILTFEVLPNEEYSDREGSIVFSGSGITETVTVYQVFEEHFILSDEEYTVSDEGATIAVEIRSNVDFTVESIDSDWVHEIETRSMSTHTRYFSVDPNTTYEQRQAHIIFRSGKGTEEQVTIIQVQNDALVLSKDVIDLEPEKQRVGIVLSTNVEDVSVIIDEAFSSWLSVPEDAGTRAMTDRTIYIEVTANDTGDMRTGYVTFTGGDQEQTLTVRQQSSNMFRLMYSEKLVDFNGGEMTVDFVRNTDYSCTIGEAASAWIHEAPATRALINDSKTFVVDRNDTDDYRSGTITFTYGNGESETLTVTQLPEGKIVLAKQQYILSAYQYYFTFEVLSNQDVEVLIPEDCSWIGLIETRAMENRTINLSIAVNSTGKNRTADIGVVTVDGTSSQTIRLIQNTEIVSQDDLQTVRDALIALYEATDGDNWTNNEGWCSDLPLSKWYGIAGEFSYTDDTETELNGISRISVNLNDNNLNGEIPGDLADIPVTLELNLTYNENITSISEHLAESQTLQGLYIANTGITSLPENIFSMPQLEHLYISDCPITSLPEIKEENRTLRYLWASWCDIAKFPEDIARLTALESLLMDNNRNWKMTGTLPENISEMTSLRVLRLNSNSLSGTLPEGICELRNLETIDLSNNEFEGCIPSDIGNLTSLIELDLNDNGFDGDIPSGIGNLTNIEKLRLSYNSLSGEIPMTLANLKNADIDISHNELSGTLTAEMLPLKLRCEYNRLDIGMTAEESTLPPDILAAATSWTMYPQKMSLAQDAAQRDILEELYYSFNGQSWSENAGWLSDAPLDEWEGISANEFGAVTSIYLPDGAKGNIPASLADLVYLTSLSGGEITGEIPEEIAFMPAWKSGWSQYYYFNYDNFANSSNMKVGITDFSVTDISGNTVTWDEVSSQADYVLVALMYPIFPYCFKALSDLKNTFGDRLAIIASCCDVSSLGLSSAEYLTGMKECTGLDMYCLSWEELTSGLPEFSSNYVQRIMTKISQAAAGMLNVWNADLLSLFDAETGASLWHGSSYYAWGGSTFIDVPVGNIANIIAGGSVSLVPYESTDYSRDGEVRTIRTASGGDGINVVIMGDAFSDREIASGVYDRYMDQACEALFSEEPYRTYQDRFNVYAVTAVSKNNVYEPLVEGAGDTVFGMYFTYGTETSCGGANDKVFEYAMKCPGIDENNINEALCIVVGNTPFHAGTCHMYADGSAVAYQGVENYDSEDFFGTLRHEAGGHGFAKLKDEYERSTGTIPSSEAAEIADQYAQYGWGANIDVTDDPSEIRWSHFLSDDRYSGLVGIYEGAALYAKGAYRPSENSIMRDNTGGYNAPSREAIFKRIMELSGEEYTWEKFVEYDAVNRGSAAKPASYRRRTVSSDFVPGAPPVYAGETWRDAY